MTLAAPIFDIAQQPNNELKGIKKLYMKILLSQSSILKVIILFLVPFISKSAYLYENIRVSVAEKQTVSPLNGPEKQAVSLHNGLEKQAIGSQVSVTVPNSETHCLLQRLIVCFSAPFTLIFSCKSAILEVKGTQNNFLLSLYCSGR